eukprot:TRINITY_DN80132_c0_g1_i1.p1 TRINITY_DN80132_c0_g1~~TRINITY_DN80132_c0_g1_i1.p1  ORF type:complete len:471 (+),score=92.60 TRINITY_DN80132_c0_g1_i1:87-1499(+)
MGDVSDAAHEYGLRPISQHQDPRCPPKRSSLGVDSVGAACSDRFIPSRASSNLQSGLTLLDENSRQKSSSSSSNKDENSMAYQQLLQDQLLGVAAERSDEENLKPRTCNNLFKYKPAQRPSPLDAFALTPVSFNGRESSESARKVPRKISQVPFKVLDAPQLQDDFYLNLVDWSASNVLAVGLSNAVYLWSAVTGRVTKLCELADDKVTSVSWSQTGHHLAVGTDMGEAQVWDPVETKKLRTMTGHRARVGAMAWNNYILSTGSRDTHIYQRDVRQQAHYMSKLSGHRQEVCGLKWSYDEQQLASGGNDNKLFVWDIQKTSPKLVFRDHQAAVKAIAWSPHQHGLLASGGGTADRCIRFWNTVNGTAPSCVDTGSQVCNLIWSKNVNEIVSTHGYSLNQVIVWKYPSMTKVTTLTGHTYRVLYLTISPDGQTIATGAGDETLRFWNVFPSTKSRSSGTVSSATPFGRTIR